MTTVLIRDREVRQTHREGLAKPEAEIVVMQAQGMPEVTRSWKRRGTEGAFRQNAVLPTLPEL